jgi:predicted enzyme related to lactoylglutathione lyase
MSERTSYAPGTPCWVDLATPDVDAAERFYGALFGWEIPELPNSAEMGGYRRATKDGRDVAGAELVNEPGAFSWNELETRDPERAKEFYGRVFGWEFDREDAPGGMPYDVARVGENRVAGMADISGRMPDAVPAHWMTYFVVEDTEGAMAKAESAGGAVQFGPIEIPVGRFAMLTDPWGAAFAVVRFSDEVEIP